ncbi:hypothetical protein IWQ60_000054 [Tieghemiomyces parasiticus]|uniref:FMR1-interacting protein 1 conserved domain-containing protein n=1 Tax=Tieghemiomyces parasiticus TaxID=78921 RepID=A0A9W8E329_9FUNG|nr:hypothetical protein IWQ60_000054 [Tieghemiomyces parasiticus]
MDGVETDSVRRLRANFSQPGALEKWLAERRSRFPTQANIAKRAEEQTHAPAEANGETARSVQPKESLADLCAYGTSSDDEGGATADGTNRIDGPSDSENSDVDPEKDAVSTKLLPAPFGTSADQPDATGDQLDRTRGSGERTSDQRRPKRGRGDRHSSRTAQGPRYLNAANSSGHNQLPTALYSRLIAQDVRRDHKRVLQCLRFIASQDFLGIRPETTQRDSKRPLIREL